VGKILITGPGRSGTTFIVQLLTRLGFDTGFRPDDDTYKDDIRAGCEFIVGVDLECDSEERIRKQLREAPRVLKSPEWGLVLKGLLTLNLMEVDHVVLPVRDLDVAAKSRLDAGLDWLVDPTLKGEERQQEQVMVHAMALGRAVEACLVMNEAYCYGKLSALGRIDRGEFTRVFLELARPGQIKWNEKTLQNA
jgi:hypothetical protein